MNDKKEKKLYKSVSEVKLPLLSTKNCSNENTFMNEITDDSSFAMNQIDRMYRLNNLRKIYKLKPWERINKINIFPTNHKSNHIILTNLKKKSTNSTPNIKNINWGENKYYNNKELNNVFDAFHISKHVKNQDEIRKNSKEKHNDVNNFSEQNKKNFINNFLYSMLKDERKKIADLEAEKIEALNNKINDFNIDLELFDEFKERVNEYTKKKEEILNFLFIENKKIYDNKKKISQENEILLDLIEKLIRQIINMKKYAIFTHKLLGGKSPILNCTLGNGISIKNNRENALEEYTNLILRELNSLIENNNEYNNVIENILDDPERIMNILEIIEYNIIKTLNKNEEYKIEMQKDKIYYENLFKGFKDKIYYLEKDYQISKKEYDKLRFQMIEYNEEKIKKDDSYYYSNLFNELYKVIIPNQSERKLLDNKINEDIYNLNSELKKVEDNLNKLIIEMENMEKEDHKLFKSITEDLKLEYRYEKYLDEKVKYENQMLKEKIRITQRMNQYTLKGRHLYNNQILPLYILKNLKKKNINKKNDENDLDFILY